METFQKFRIDFYVTCWKSFEFLLEVGRVSKMINTAFLTTDFM